MKYLWSGCITITDPVTWPRDYDLSDDFILVMCHII